MEYEQSKGLRDLKRIRVVWTDRDPDLVTSNDMVHRSSQPSFGDPPVRTRDVETQEPNTDLQSLASGSVYHDGETFVPCLASVLLSSFPPRVEPDQDQGQESDLDGPLKPRKRRGYSSTKLGGSKISAGGDESTFRTSVQEILELQVI